MRQSVAHRKRDVRDSERQVADLNARKSKLEAKLADLEGGVDCACFGTGMSAVLATMLAFLEAGAHAVVSDVAYGGTYRFCTQVLARFGVEFTFADSSDISAVEEAEMTILLMHGLGDSGHGFADVAQLLCRGAEPKKWRFFAIFEG